VDVILDNLDQKVWHPLQLWVEHTGVPIALVLVGALLVARGVNWIGRYVTRRIDAQYQQGNALVRSESTKHRHSVAQVITWGVLTMVWIIAAMRCVEVLRLPLAGFVAPATVLGAALGFGAQRIVQDLLAGFFIVTERQYGFGDTVRIAVTGSANEAAGVVEDVTLRVTKMRNADGEVITVPNGQIVKAVNLSKDWARTVIDVPVPASADLNRVDAILHRVGQEAFRDKSLRKLLLDAPTVTGIEELGVDESLVRVVARTLPGRQFEVARELRARIANALRSQGIFVTTAMGPAQEKEDEELQKQSEIDRSEGRE
jgi:small conductance mechanosensitive channel